MGNNSIEEGARQWGREKIDAETLLKYDILCVCPQLDGYGSLDATFTYGRRDFTSRVDPARQACFRSFGRPINPTTRLNSGWILGQNFESMVTAGKVSYTGTQCSVVYSRGP